MGVAFVSSATRWRCPQGIVLLPVTDLDLPLPFELTWRKDNGSPLLANFVAAVRVLLEVVVFAKSANQRTTSSTIRGSRRGGLSQLTRLDYSRLFASYAPS